MNNNETMIYQIRVEGHLDTSWVSWFDGLQVTCLEDGMTEFSGPVADQAALHGLLAKIRDLRLPLVSVLRLEPKSFDNN